MRNESSIECVAQNKTVLVSGYEASTFWQLQEGEQYLLGKKFNMYSTRVANNLVLNLTSFLHEGGIKAFVSLLAFEAIKTRFSQN